MAKRSLVLNVEVEVAIIQAAAQWGDSMLGLTWCAMNTAVLTLILAVFFAFDTSVHLPDGGEWRDALTGETHADGALARVLRRLPVAVPTPANTAAGG